MMPIVWKRSDVQRGRIWTNDGRDPLDDTGIGVWIVKHDGQFVLRVAGNGNAYAYLTETSRSKAFLKVLGEIICEWSATTEVANFDHRRTELRNRYHKMWTEADDRMARG